MLLSRGFQPPRKYTIPEPDPLASPITTPCAVCTSKAWTAELYTKLKTATNDVKSSVHRYTLTSNELREMVIRGCQFCRSLADGIHGQIFLDELYARFEAQEVNSSGEDEDILGETSGENNQDEEEWNDASAFNEDDIDDDVTGGWDTWQDRDTLSENRKMNVEMSFEQGDEGIFTFLNVYIRTAEDEHRGTGKLGLLEDESIVSLRYHTNQKGTRWPLTETIVAEICAPVELDHKLFPVTKAGVALGAEQHLQAIASWAESLQHGIAKEKLTQGQMPARLIDIGQAGSLTIVDTSTIRPPPKFAALSYVWGTNQSFVLTNKSIAVLQIHFQAQQLPQTIQDAITVATRAGLKYIWIDAL